jgi:hypothetical protein
MRPIYFLLLLNTFGWNHLVCGQSSLRAWKYRSELIIDHTSSAETVAEYQTHFAFDARPLIKAGKIAPDGKDLRLIDSNGKTLLCHWLEGELDKGPVRIWVKIPYLEAGERKTVYLYYGNPAAVSVADGSCTFQSFDDFAGPTIDTEKWEQAGGGSLRIDRGKAHFQANGSDIVLRSYAAVQMPVIIEMWVTRSTGKFISLALTNTSPVFWDGYALAIDHARKRAELALTDPEVTPCGGFSFLASFKASPMEERIDGLWSLSWLTSNTLMGNWPGGALLEQNSFREQKKRRIALGVLACSFQGSFAGELEVDWIRVRKFLAQEPPTSLGPETPNTSAEVIIAPGSYTG